MMFASVFPIALRFYFPNYALRLIVAGSRTDVQTYF